MVAQGSFRRFRTELVADKTAAPVSSCDHVGIDEDVQCSKLFNPASTVPFGSFFSTGSSFGAAPLLAPFVVAVLMDGDRGAIQSSGRTVWLERVWLAILG